MVFEGEVGLESNKDLVIERHCGVTVWSTIKALKYAGDTRNGEVGDLAENLAVGERKEVVLPRFLCVLSWGKGGCAWSKDGNGRWSFYSLTLRCLYQEIATVEAHKRAHAPTVIKERISLENIVSIRKGQVYLG